MPRGSPTPQSLSTLLELMKLGAGRSYADVSSTRLGEAIGLTQQAASKRLIDLEGSGLVERVHSGRSLRVRLTPRGLAAVHAVYGGLRGAFEEPPKEMTFTGTLFTGFREGSYYVSLKGYARAFRRTLGFVPYPGTLNLRLSTPRMVGQRTHLASLEGVKVPGFEDGKRTYGPVYCFRAKVEGKHPAAVLAIERTHYDHSVLEVISPVNLRKALGLRDGDECSVTAYV